jgi:hypothetical protein
MQALMHAAKSKEPIPANKRVDGEAFNMSKRGTLAFLGSGSFRLQRRWISSYGARGMEDTYGDCVLLLRDMGILILAHYVWWRA